MVRPEGVPENAPSMFYATSAHSGGIWWWQVGEKWYWVAGGNNGEEATERQAVDRAKRWLRDGQ